MAEFLEMNSHMESWLNSWILKYSRFSSKFISVRENVLLIPSNHHSFFSSLQAQGCCVAAAQWLPGGAAATANVWCCTQQSREDMEGLVSTWWTSLASRSAGPNCQQESFKLRYYQRDQPQGHNPEGKDIIQREQSGRWKAFKQERADNCNKMHNSSFRPNNDMEIHWGRFGWRKLPIWLLPAALFQHRHKQDATHYWGSKRSSILRKKSPVERNIVRWNRRLDWIAWLLQTNLSSTVLNTKIWKCPSFSVFIYWKFEYKQSLKPNDV